MPEQQNAPATDSANEHSRRGLIANLLLLAGVVAGYGLGAVHFFRYLVPLGKERKLREMFVGTLADIPVGSSIAVRDPRGQEINLVRLSDDSEHPERGFRALSSKCPHLGCRVHWEEANHRFFCPCHAGVFDKQGKALEGPPAKERKDLSTYQVRVDARNGWVYVMVAQEQRYGA